MKTTKRFLYIIGNILAAVFIATSIGFWVEYIQSAGYLDTNCQTVMGLYCVLMNSDTIPSVLILVGWAFISPVLVYVAMFGITLATLKHPKVGEIVPGFSHLTIQILLALIWPLTIAFGILAFLVGTTGYAIYSWAMKIHEIYESLLSKMLEENMQEENIAEE